MKCKNSFSTVARLALVVLALAIVVSGLTGCKLFDLKMTRKSDVA